MEWLDVAKKDTGEGKLDASLASDKNLCRAAMRSPPTTQLRQEEDEEDHRDDIRDLRIQQLYFFPCCI